MTAECLHASETVLRDLQNLLRWAVSVLQKRKPKLGELKPMFTSKGIRSTARNKNPKELNAKYLGHTQLPITKWESSLCGEGTIPVWVLPRLCDPGKSPHHTRFWGHSLPIDVRAQHMTSLKETHTAEPTKVLSSQNLSGNDICPAGDPAMQLLSSHPNCRL